MVRMVMEHFDPLIRAWFAGRFAGPTEAQRLGWPAVATGRHTLIAAPTGSGKTLAAFLVCLDRLWRDWQHSALGEGIQVVYVSPLKALSNDIERNLQAPLAEISALAERQGLAPAPIAAAVRTGDTPGAQRQAMLRRPPHILVTTPESLYLLLTSARGREPLRRVRTLIVDEIHALARDKRGSHLALSVERLAELADTPLLRIGLSATQRPIEEMARFLVGAGSERVEVVRATEQALSTRGADALRQATPRSNAVTVVDTGHARQLDLAIEVPPSELSAVCSNEQWDQVYQRLASLVAGHRSTLIFVNTRRLAERVTHRLAETVGQQAVASHHGSLSRELRWSAEQRLKQGELKAIVATASLEMGIDIGYIDLVCQLGSPRSIAAVLQRVGRSGHRLGATPRGRLFPLTRDELLECMALVRAVRRGILDATEIPLAPLDILAQQIVASVACEDWDEGRLFEMVRRAWPYRGLSREDFEAILRILGEGMTSSTRRGAYLHRDRIAGRLRARRGARLAALTSGGAIPETAEYRVETEPEGLFVGTVDEDFAIESLAGDVFLLGNTSWRIQQVRASKVLVRDANGAPPSIPFWFGEAPGRTIELSEELSALRQEIAPADDRAQPGEGAGASPLAQRLEETCGVDGWGARQALDYVAAQFAAIGRIPTTRDIVFERFFDESGGMQLVIHAPLGARINRAWGLALRKRFCRSFDFELQAAATDNGILLSIGPQHSFPIDALFGMLHARNAIDLLKQATLAAPMFQVRWRWNVTRALAVLRNQAGKKVPPALQRFRADDLLAAAFPETVGCLENHHGDVAIPDHPMVRQTMHDCLHEAMDLDRWIGVLERIDQGAVRLHACDTREPSPFSYELLNANPYAFLDDAPLEERRARAVETRRTLRPEEVRDLARLDPAAIEQVRREAWPLVRDAEELHDALSITVAMPLAADIQCRTWYTALEAQGRAATVLLRGEPRWWIAAENVPVLKALFPESTVTPDVRLPAALQRSCDPASALEQLLRGWMQCRGPVSATDLAAELELAGARVWAALEALEAQGLLLRGQFLGPPDGADQVDWCDRRLLARIHRLTIERLRQQVRPVSPVEYLYFLATWHRLVGGLAWHGRAGVREAVAMLEGYELPAGAWERVLAMRVDPYEPDWLDALFLSGELTWGRLCPPRHGGETRAAAWNRTVPISLQFRENLCWLIDPRPSGECRLSGNAERVQDRLSQRGALYLQELAADTQLPAEQLGAALRELAAAGLITSDLFAAVRGLVRRSKWDGQNADRHGARTATGRWSLFPGTPGERCPAEARLQRWAEVLLRRYGVLFRDLLARESAAPSWSQLVPILRKMELRGEVRGGRFVEGVSGEQYAHDLAVARLRATRESFPRDDWVLVSAADPVNLAGIVGGGERIAPRQRDLLILAAEGWVATRLAGRVEFRRTVAPAAEDAMREVLTSGRRRRPSATQPAPSRVSPAALRRQARMAAIRHQ